MTWPTPGKHSTFNHPLTINIDRTSRLWFNICMVEKALFIALVALALVTGAGYVRDAVSTPFETATAALDDSVDTGPTRGWED